MPHSTPNSSAVVSLRLDDGVHCHRHLDAGATGRCSGCSRALCEACTSYGDVGIYCVFCAQERRANLWKRRYATIAVMTAAVMAIVATSVASKEEEKRGHYGPLAGEAEAVLARDPCDASAALTLMRAMRPGGAYAQAIDVATEHLEHCGDDPFVRLERARAHLAINENGLAKQDAEHVIRAFPDEAEGHGVLAAIHERMKKPALALEEHRAAWLLNPLRRASVVRQKTLLVDRDAACDALTPVLVENFLLRDTLPFPLRTRSDYLMRQCDERISRGAAELDLDGEVPVTLASSTEMATIDTHAPLTIIPRSLAAEARALSAHGTRMITARGVVTGHVARVPSMSIGDAWANDVDVFLVEEGPVVVGAGFLARFAWAPLDETHAKLTGLSDDTSVTW